MNPNDKLAKWLCFTYSDDTDIPAKYKPDKKRKKFNDDTKVQKLFDANLLGWKGVVEVVQNSFEKEQAKRFLISDPQIEGWETTCVDCQDFLNFYDFFMQRRDVDNCCDDELGKLSALLNEFQKVIEKQLGSKPTASIADDESEVKLKNTAAQALMVQGTCVIDGIEVSFWQGHSYGSVSTQATWNKVKSYTELNSNSSGENGSVCITGVLQIPRQEACEYAASLGFKVRSNISRHTNYVVMGSENVSPSKIAQALELKRDGADIQFMDEIAFLTLLSENMELDDHSDLSATA